MAELHRRSRRLASYIVNLLALFVVLVVAGIAPGQTPLGQGISSGSDSNRLPAPSPATASEGLKVVKDTFKQEYAKKSVADRRALAVILLTTAEQPGSDATTKFVLYGEARELAIAAGDLKTALRAIDGLCQHFIVNDAEIKSKAGAALVQAHLSNSDSADLAAFLHAATVDALALGDYASALRLAAVEETSAAHSHRDALIATARADSGRGHSMLVQSERGENALKKLKGNPDDPQANFEAGQFLCYVKDDWEHGLPLLAKGSDAELKSLALSDQSHPSDLKSIMYIAGKWWDLSTSRHGDETPLRERAAYWYRQALPLANGLELVLAQRRIGSAQAAVKPLRIVILKADYGVEGHTFSVVKQIQAAIDADPFFPICSGNHWAGDPADGKPKHLDLSYRIGGSEVTIVLQQNDVCTIPALPENGIAAPGASQALTIVKARYGADAAWVDVTEAVSKIATSTSAEIPAGIKLAGRDPLNGKPKHTVIWYEYQGRRYCRIANDATSRLQP